MSYVNLFHHLLTLPLTLTLPIVVAGGNEDINTGWMSYGNLFHHLTYLPTEGKVSVTIFRPKGTPYVGDRLDYVRCPTVPGNQPPSNQWIMYGALLSLATNLLAPNGYLGKL
jgi:hypothetical protein